MAGPAAVRPGDLRARLVISGLPAREARARDRRDRVRRPGDTRAVTAARVRRDAVGSRDGDLLDPSVPAQLIAEIRPSHLLHIAWEARPGDFWTSPDNLDWTAASLPLLRAFAEGGGTRAVLAGSCAEYAWADETHCVEGETPLNPATLYGASKDALRQVAEAYAREAGLSLAWGGFFVFGPHEHPARLASSVARALVAGEPAETSHGRQVCEFLFPRTLPTGSSHGSTLRSRGRSMSPRASRCRSGRSSRRSPRPPAARTSCVLVRVPPTRPSRISITAAVDRLRDEVGLASGAGARGPRGGRDYMVA